MSRLFSVPGRQGMRLSSAVNCSMLSTKSISRAKANASATTFGRITATRDGDPGRIGQVALKLLW